MENRNSKKGGKGRNSLITLQEPLISTLIPANPQLMEMTCDNARPQCQHPDIRPDELVAQGVGEAFLAGFVGVVDGLAGERWSLERCGRRDVENCAASGTGLHRSVQHGMCRVHVSGDICCVHCFNRRDWEGVERGGGVECEAGLVVNFRVSLEFPSWYGRFGKGQSYVVDQDVDFTQLFYCGRHGGIDGFVVAHVGCPVDDLTVYMTGTLKLLLQSAEFVLAIGQRTCHERLVDGNSPKRVIG